MKRKLAAMIHKDMIPWAALTVLLGWADITITLLGQPADYWQSFGLMAEDDPIGRLLLSIGPWVFYLFLAFFHLLEGWLVLTMPKWIAWPVAAYCISCGVIAVFLWISVMGYWQQLLTCGTIGYGVLGLLMAVGAVSFIVRIARK